MNQINPYNIIKTYQSILKRLPRRYRSLFLFLLIGMIIAGALETVTLGVIAFFVSSVVNPDAILNSSYIKYVQNVTPVSFLINTHELMIFLSVLVVVLVALKNSINGIITYSAKRYSAYAATHLGEQMLRGFLSINYEWHLSHNSADLSLAVFWRWYYGQFIGSLLQSLSDIIIVLIVLSAVFFMEPLVSLMVISVLGVSAVIIFNRVRKLLDQTLTQVRDYRQSINREVTKSMQGIKDVKIYSRQQYFVSDYRQRAYIEAKYDALQIFLTQCPQWILELFGFFMLALAIYLMMFSMKMSPERVTGTVALLAVAAWRTLPALNKILNKLALARTALPFVHKGLEYLREVEPKVHENDLQPIAHPPIFNKSLKFIDISFRYSGASDYALQGVNFSISRGRTIGVVGFSGAGKSTFADLLIGLLTPTRGRIEIDGKRMNKDLFPAWTSIVGYVAQTPYIFDGTIIENVAFGLKGKAINRELAMQCCEMAAMGDFIHDLPDGIDSVIGERGVMLSGGQRQRVAIARALYNKPDVLIFDEATSSLDTKSEKAIQRTIYSFKGKQTLVIIAHRLSTVEDCDEIIWLEKGRVRQIGPPKEILPIYKQLMQDDKSGLCNFD